MRTFLTGGNGFIGTACAVAMHARGIEVLAPSSSELNLLDERAVAAFLSDTRPTHLIHAGWRPVHGDVMASADNGIWKDVSLALLRRFHEAGGLKAVCLGSCSEYEWREAVCRTGVTPLRPATPYGAAKHALHLALQDYAARTRLRYAWLRIFFVYGPGEHESRLCASVAKSLLYSRPAEMTHGRQIRDYLYVGDVAEAVVLALLSEFEGATDVASGIRRSVRELATAFGRQLGREHLLRFGSRPPPADEAPFVLGDPGHARVHLGWTALTDLDAGVAAEIAWARRQFSARDADVRTRECV
jgi:nucleoside-diphosphate-sugar epimerase